MSSGKFIVIIDFPIGIVPVGFIRYQHLNLSL